MLISALVTVLVVLVVVGFLLYLFNQFVTLDPRFKNAINALVCLIAFLYIVSVFLGHGGGISLR